MISRRLSVLATVLCAGTGVAVGRGAAALLETTPPDRAVGTWVIDLTPHPVAQSAIDAFGTADKTVLRGGVLLVLLVAAVVFGAGRRTTALTGSVLLGLTGVLAAATTRGATESLVVRTFPAVLALAVSTFCLSLLLTPKDAPEGRRAFFQTAGGVAGIAAVGGFTGALTPAKTVVTTTALPVPSSPAPKVVNADFGAAPYLTPTRDFYRIDVNLVVPRVRAETWELEITGMVDRPLKLTYADLLKERMVERDITMTCVSNEVGGELVGTARWLGVPVRDLLQRAGVKPEADAVKSTGVDGWTAGTGLSLLTDPMRDAMFAIAMNGEPLPEKHGYPVRMVVPGAYGYVSATKWVTQLEVTRFDRFESYWIKRGWGVEGSIKTEVRLESPAAYAELPVGRTVVAGVAWAQHRGISKVEVKVDDGEWQEAELAAWNNRDTWRHWRWEWDAPAGDHALFARATDATGEVQTAERVDVFPDGATGYHVVPVRIA